MCCFFSRFSNSHNPDAPLYKPGTDQSCQNMALAAALIATIVLLVMVSLGISGIIGYQIGGIVSSVASFTQLVSLTVVAIGWARCCCDVAKVYNNCCPQ